MPDPAKPDPFRGKDPFHETILGAPVGGAPQIPKAIFRIPVDANCKTARLVLRGIVLAAPSAGGTAAPAAGLRETLQAPSVPPAAPAAGGREFVVPFNGAIRIGRDRTQCQIAIEGDRRVSRQHIQFSLVAGQAQVSDLGSTNGTLLNGRPLVAMKTERLKPNDEIQIGTVRITFLA